MSTNDNCNNDLGLTLGMLTLRIWLAMRAIQTGIEKFAGTVPTGSDCYCSFPQSGVTPILQAVDRDFANNDANFQL